MRNDHPAFRSIYLAEEFRPYVEAVSKVLEGVAVEDLQRLEFECITDYQRNLVDQPGAQPEDAIFSICAHAENEILQGRLPDELYSEFNPQDPEHFRHQSRAITGDMITHIL